MTDDAANSWRSVMLGLLVAWVIATGALLGARVLASVAGWLPDGGPTSIGRAPLDHDSRGALFAIPTTAMSGLAVAACVVAGLQCARRRRLAEVVLLCTALLTVIASYLLVGWTLWIWD